MHPLRIGIVVVISTVLVQSLPVFGAKSVAQVHDPRTEGPAVPFGSGRLLVRFHATTPAEERRQALAALGGQEIGRIPALDTLIVATHDLERSVGLLNARSDIVWAEPDHLARIHQERPGQVPGPRPGPRADWLYVPVAIVAEDPFAEQQWHHALIRTGEAWRYSRGRDTVIAIVDTGVDCELPELARQCVSGFDFLGDNPHPHDDHGHGTDVASIAAATANNGVGGVGVAPDARIMPLKAMGANGYGSYAAIASAVVWATDHGADVINLSLGGYFDSATLRSAVSYAAAHGLVIVAAAGNDSLTLPAYPAAYPGVITVAATDREDRHWPPSNRGAHIDLAAPGARVATATLHGWGERSGTSEATPIVSGVAALIRARNPGLTAAEVRDRLIATAVDLGEPGWDPLFGYGRVDAAASVRP